MPTLGMVGKLDMGNGADVATVDGLNGYVDLLCLFLNGSDDAAEWQRAFAQFVTGLYEADRLRSTTEPETPEQMADSLISDGVIGPESRAKAVAMFTRSAPVAPVLAPPLCDDGAACREAGAFLRALDGLA